MFRTRSLAFIKHATTLNRRNLQPTTPLLVPSSSSSSNGLPWPPVCPRWSLTSPSAARRSSTAALSNTTIRSVSSNSKDPHQEAIEKAQQLHAELNEMIAAQKAAQKAASEKPYSSTVKEFLRSSKAQLFNIFFAFVCVLLAYQIHGLRRGYKKLLGDIQERDEEVERLRLLLRTICDIDEHDPQHVTDGEEQDMGNEQHNDQQHQHDHPPSFSLALSEKCTAAIQSLFAQSDTQPGYTWIMGRKLASSDPMESARLTDVLREIIVRELRDAVGNAVWSAEEKKHRRVVELLQSDVGENVGSVGGVMGREGGEAQLSGLVEVLQQVHEEDLVDGKTLNGDGGTSLEGGKVKRMRYAI